VLAVTSGALAVAAHAAAGGGLPQAAPTVLLTAGVAAVGVSLADRQRSLRAILAVLAAAQLATHVILSIGAMDMPSQADGRVMFAAHALAVGLSAVLLARADAAVFRVAGILSMLLPVALAVPPVPDGPVRVHRRRTPQDRRTAVLLCRRHARRGPPRAA
jgi:hypothetical protein